MQRRATGTFNLQVQDVDSIQQIAEEAAHNRNESLRDSNKAQTSFLATEIRRFTMVDHMIQGAAVEEAEESLHSF